MLWTLLLAWAIVAAINVAPAFMPASWAVLALFRIRADPPLLPLTLGGALASTLGRLLLAVGSRRLAAYLPDRDRRNAEALGAFVNRNRARRELLVFLYCLGPFPSNPLFIAAGLGRIPLRPVALAFFLSRAVADTFWVWTADTVSTGLGDVFLRTFKSWYSLTAQIAALLAVVLVLRLPWARWLRVSDTAFAQGNGERVTSSQSDPAGSARKRA